MVGQIYPTELQLNKANSSDTEAPFLDLNLSITNGIVSSKIYDKRGMGAQWLSGGVLDSRPRGRGFEPHWRHCVVVLEEDTIILA